MSCACCDQFGNCRPERWCCTAHNKSTQLPPKAWPQPRATPWQDDITPVGGTALDDELESDLADAALGLLMTLILVSATAFAAGFVFARFIE